ncbi:hypothetical protein ONZ45_g11048 [Pleurotus djamor]|nr:hypothetical protein ONZ45_g11048 [Pleurotus djamor]
MSLSSLDADDMSTSFVDIAAGPIPNELGASLLLPRSSSDLKSTLEPQTIVESQPASDLRGQDSLEPEPNQGSEATPSQSYMQSLYVFEDGDMRLLVDGVFYCIHSHFIDIHSPSLRDRCDTMNIAKGEDTLVLTLVSSEGFSNVLWIFYDETLELIASPEKWLSILLTAEKLQMTKVIDLAVTNLNRLTPPVADPISIIITQHRHHIREDWADAAYTTICKRSDSLSEAEIGLLGTRLTALVSKAREATLKTYGVQSRRVALDVVSEFGERSGTCCGLVCEPLQKDGPYRADVRSGNISIEVGKTIFAIHRHFLVVQAPRLLQLLEHKSDNKDSIRLKDVDEVQFSWFLWVLYDRPFTMTPGIEQWTAIYSIAEKFDMVHIRRLVLEYFKDVLTPVEQLARATQLKISGDLFNEAMQLMCDRSTPPTRDEGERLGVDLLTKITQERESKLNEEVLQLREELASYRAGRKKGKRR